MSPKKRDNLRTLEPNPIDERSLLLGNDQEEDDLEAQAEQERREYDAGHAPVAEEPSTRKLLLTMGSLWLTSFFAALDTSVVATLSGPISSSFNSGTSFSWIASGYLVANAACQPLSGKLTDIYGRRAGLIFAVTFFVAGTLMCGLAQNDKMMIAGRVIAGMGGGCINTVSVFVASDLIPLRRRGVWQGIGNIVFGAGLGLGGVYGGCKCTSCNIEMCADHDSHQRQPQLEVRLLHTDTFHRGGRHSRRLFDQGLPIAVSRQEGQ